LVWNYNAKIGTIMPKYSFKCRQCESLIQMYVSRLTETVACKSCQDTMDRQLPTLNGPSNVREVIDKNTGITWTDGQQDMIKDRKSQYYWSVEVPRFVNSGTYSLETMLENQWIYVDDAGKIHTNTKPPDKR